MSVMYAVKVAGPRHDAADVYWREPFEKRRALFETLGEARRLAEREGGYVVEVKLRARPGGGRR